MQPIEQLKAALARQEVVVVVGTGVSSQISENHDASTWRGLIADGIERVIQQDENQGILLQLRLEGADTAADLISIAQDLRRKLGPNFGRWIDSVVGALPLSDSNVAISLASLNVPILTTNYDTLLERALARNSTTWSQPDQMRKVVMKHTNHIGHLHGIYTDPDNIIFTEADYRTIRENKAAQDVQTSAFTMKTFLFVGFGSGLDDPNFSPMIQGFGEHYRATSGTHFKLVLDRNVNELTEIESVIDIGYGDKYSDLPGFLDSLAPKGLVQDTADLTSSSRESILDRVRDNSTLWRDADSLANRAFSDLVIPPIFLPEAHDQYATNSVLNSEKDKLDLVDAEETLKRDGIVIIAGEENSGVSTAISWALEQAMTLRPQSHAIVIEDPHAPGQNPVQRVVDRSYKLWGREKDQQMLEPHAILGIDNLRFEESKRFERAIKDIATSNAGLKIVGVRQEDVVEVANALTNAGGDPMRIVYLGRFSQVEAQELAKRVAPGREAKVARTVMVIVKEKNLPRTPFTITLLVELVQSGILLQKQESEIAILDQYIDLLLKGDFIRARGPVGMTLRNKRLVLELLARKFVQEKEDSASHSRVLEWLSEQFRELGWSYDALACTNDLIDRRILARGTENTIRFQRSAYLELMAGIAAKQDVAFRQMVFSAPIQLASIVRTYSAMARNDNAALELVEVELDRIVQSPPTGSAFGSVRRLEAKKDLFSHDDTSESASPRSGDSEATVEREGVSKSYYDDSDDSDTPAFLTARVEDLPPAKFAMLVVDLASRVLRDSDEIRDQGLKERVLRKLLLAWVSFTDLYEAELAGAPELDEVIKTIYPENDPSEDDLDKFKSALLRVVPCFTTLGGIKYCLTSPSLVTRLAQLNFDGEMNASFGAIMRTLVLHATDSPLWVDSLKDLDERAVKSFFSASFFAALARYSYITDDSLTDEHRDRIRDYLRRVITYRYNFRDVQHRVSSLNSFEDGLRKARLSQGKSSKVTLSISD